MQCNSVPRSEVCVSGNAACFQRLCDGDSALDWLLRKRHRAAKIKKVIGIGNGFKLAGLQKFLQQNLQYEVERLEHLDGVTGDSVLGDSVFTDNVMTFAVPYGLALQTLNQTRIRTTLLPPEIVTARKIRRKKPWVVGMVASLLLALGISTAVTASVRQSVSEERFSTAYNRVKELEQFVSSLKNRLFTTGNSTQRDCKRHRSHCCSA